MADPDDRMAAHEVKGYRERGAVERAIAGFLGARMSRHPRNVSTEEVEEFIRQSPDYVPLLAAIKEAADAR